MRSACARLTERRATDAFDRFAPAKSHAAIARFTKKSERFPRFVRLTLQFPAALTTAESAACVTWCYTGHGRRGENRASVDSLGARLRAVTTRHTSWFQNDIKSRSNPRRPYQIGANESEAGGYSMFTPDRGISRLPAPTLVTISSLTTLVLNKRSKVNRSSSNGSTDRPYTLDGEHR
jgi:hypothetical protein